MTGPTAETVGVLPCKFSQNPGTGETVARLQAASQVRQLLVQVPLPVWLDKAEMQWVKLDAECIDNLSWGLFLARLHKGAHILVELTRVNGEVWLSKHEVLKVEVRVALLKNFKLDEDTTYRDYKKFRTNSKIVGMQEVPEHK